MISEVEKIRDEACGAINNIVDLAELERITAVYMGKKSRFQELARSLGQLSKEKRAEFGRAVNDVKKELFAEIAARREALEAAQLAVAIDDPYFDLTQPGSAVETGSYHPLTLVRERLEDIFEGMGFSVLEYPEAESEFYNFDALNIPADHPARDMQDTFWLEQGNVLRTHTSNGQVRALRKFGAPLRAVFPGRCFRYEETDASHEHTFHQMEGLMVDRHISVANLVAMMNTLLDEVFERKVLVRLRPGYFPFVEPGFELDIGCLVCNGSGCSVCKQSGWLELLPCGLVHPAVLRAGGLDPDKWQGWAFGLGLSRLVMMKYGINDIRRLASTDLRFLRQYTGVYR